MHIGFVALEAYFLETFESENTFRNNSFVQFSDTNDWWCLIMWHLRDNSAAITWSSELTLALQKYESAVYVYFNSEGIVNLSNKKINAVYNIKLYSIVWWILQLSNHND